MNIEIVKADKNDVEIKIDNVTVAEILRTYMGEQGVSFAAWRRDHPSKPASFKIQTSGKSVKKTVSDAVSAIKKDTDKIDSGLKKK